MGRKGNRSRCQNVLVFWLTTFLVDVQCRTPNEKRRLDAERRNTSNSKYFASRRPNLHRIIRSTSINSNDKRVPHLQVASGGVCSTKSELTRCFATGKGGEWHHAPKKFFLFSPHHAVHCPFYFGRFR